MKELSDLCSLITANLGHGHTKICLVTRNLYRVHKLGY